VCGKLVSAHCMTAASRLRGPLSVASCCQPTSGLKTGSYSELHVFVLNLAIAVRGSVLLIMVLAMDAGPLLGVVSYCQPTSWLRVAGAGHGELLPTDFVDRWGVQLSGDFAAENWFSVRCHVLVLKFAIAGVAVFY
jgi:hypothetical protein